jgi:hypothetical protein
MEGAARILLFGETLRNASMLQDRLVKKGCRLEFAASVEHALAAIGKAEFDLVLCETGPHEGGGNLRLIAPLVGTRSNLLFSLPVEDGCWWVPAVWRGKECLGAPAISWRDFSSLLERILAQIQTDYLTMAEADA